LALISSGGNLSADASLTLATANNADLLLATTDGNSIVIASTLTNNGATALTNLVVSGSTSAAITPPVPNNVADVVGANVGLYTTGGNVGSSAAPLEINASHLDGFTNGALTPGGNAFVTDTIGGVTVGSLDAGAGAVTLSTLDTAGTDDLILAASGTIHGD